MPLWLQGGWAIDAKLNRITRDHEDIDIAYPDNRSTNFLALLQTFSFVVTEHTSYGFLAEKATFCWIVSCAFGLVTTTN